MLFLLCGNVIGANSCNETICLLFNACKGGQDEVCQIACSVWVSVGICDGPQMTVHRDPHTRNPIAIGPSIDTESEPVPTELLAHQDSLLRVHIKESASEGTPIRGLGARA